MYTYIYIVVYIYIIYIYGRLIIVLQTVQMPKVACPSSMSQTRRT